MTLNTTYSPAVADGNGVTTNFSYSFDPISISYLKVSLEINGVWVQQLSGWTATTSPNGGIVTFATAPTTRVAIERDVPEEQPTSYETSSGFQAKVIENSFDMLTGMVQELKEASERSVKVDVGSSTDPDAVVRQVDRVYASIDNVDAVADDLLNVDTLTADLTNVDIVAGSITNVNKVGNDITNVNAVATNETNVNTVASNISDVNTVASDMTNVSAVGNDLTNIDAVANNQTNIDTVAGIDSDVSAVASIKNDVTTVSGISSAVSSVSSNSANVNTVATNIANVNSVGGSITNVNKVANKITDVSTVAGDLTDIGTVATNIANVNAVGGSIANVNSVASDLTNVDAVAGNKTNIDTVAGISGNVTTVAGISSAVGTVAGIDDEVVAVSGNATNINLVGSNIGNVNSVAGNISNVNAVASNETNINAVNANKTNINTVAGISGDVTSVANNGTNVTAVAGNETNINAVNANKTNINAVAGNSANINSVATNIANVNTVAGDHANIQAVVNNMTAINNAPTYANNSKIWAEGLDGEVAPLGGTHSSKGWAQIAEAAASGVQNPANRDLSNLTNTGQMIIDSQNGTISNCILEIPHTFNVTLENNVVTVKSGSTFVLTGSTYATRTLTADKTVDLTSRSETKVYILMSASDSIVPWFNYENTGSVTTLPADSSQYMRVFNVTDKQYYLWSDAANAFTVWGQNLASYPLCVVEKVNGVWQFAKDSNGNDMIFNGVGFIGHHAFVYPNIVGLASDGIDTDGNLKSTRFVTNALRITEMQTSTNNFVLNADGVNIFFYSKVGVSEVQNYGDIIPSSWNDYYVKSENKVYGTSGSTTLTTRKDVVIIDCAYDGTTVTDFTIRQPVRLATTEMLDSLQSQVDTNTTDISTKAGLSDNNTFTGDNTFSKAITLTTAASESGTTYYGYMYEKVTNIDYTTNPSYNGYYYNWMFRDKNNKLLAYETSIYGTSGNSSHTVTVQTRNTGNTDNVSASYTLNIARDGSASFTIPAPTQDNTTSTQADTVGARNTKLQGYANTSLSNLSSDGQMIIDSQNGTISNCILEIPQNIKLTLENNVLTLKAGSVLVNSGSIYSTKTINSDIVTSAYTGANLKYMLFTQGGYIRSYELSDIVSGNTDTQAGTTWHCWFDTENKNINTYGSDATTPVVMCYPICVIESDSNGVWSFAKDSNGNDMIFNGAGYIGHHAFVYPNVSAFISDGYDTDGKLKSYKKTITALSILEMGNGNNAIKSIGNNMFGRNGYEVVNSDDDITPSAWKLFYVKSTNSYRLYNGSLVEIGATETPLITYSCNGTMVTKFDIRQPYEGARDLLTDSLQADVTTLTGYDSTQTQTLKNINGVLQWVTD